MGKFNQLLSKRFKSEVAKKTSSLAALSQSGQLSSFSGVFNVSPLGNKEKEQLSHLLKKNATKSSTLNEDLSLLLTLTSEVKAIHNQSVILHGERIKKAQTVLKKYKDGTFTQWMLSTYGNRQTPYNFLQYYELYISLSVDLQNKVDGLPKQVIYSLSSREADRGQKQAFISSCQFGETKQQLLLKLREKFPLKSKDKRKTDTAKATLVLLKKVAQEVKRDPPKLDEKQKKTALHLLSVIQSQLL